MPLEGMTLGNGHNMKRAAPAANVDFAHEPADAERTTTSTSKELRSCYLRILLWSFTIFSSLRIMAYLPTMWSIWDSGDSSQHSIFTWVTWVGANASMAAWLFESNGQKMDRAILTNACNAFMCLIIALLIGVFRFS